MNCGKSVSNPIINRLPKYYRILCFLKKLGVRNICSKELGDEAGVSPSQIRSDFMCFGGEGLRGSGYNVNILINKISEFLGLNEVYNLAIIGAGNMGQALAKNRSLERKGFRVVGIFDTNDFIIGKKIGAIEIKSLDHLSEFVNQNHIDIAIITVSSTYAAEVINKVIEVGIKGIWNFSQVNVNVPADVVIENVYLSDSLMVLAHNLKNYKTASQFMP